MKKIALASVIALASIGAQAQMYGEVGYTATTAKKNVNGNGIKASPSALRGILGYELNPNLAVEGMVAFGMSDATVEVNGVSATGVKLGIDNALGLYLKPKTKLNDLPWRMLVGALLTFSVTSLAAALGEVWSGILAVFPVIGLVLAVFTHNTLGPTHVTQVYRGMVKGLYSFATFFLTLTLLLEKTSLLIAALLSVVVAIVTQVILQFIAKSITKN
jgi:uncharacterized membrane protein (GlpM family)